MTKEEVGKVLALLTAYYGQGRTFDVRQMVEGWYYVIGEYDYNTAKRAVVEFARNDTRDYASFPTAGSVRKAIENECNVPNKIFAKIRANTPYERLTQKERRYISEKAYEKALKLREEQLLDSHKTIIEYMRGNERNLLQ